MTVDQRICNIIYTLLGVEDVHGSEGLVSVADADYVLSHLDGVAILGVETSDECICIALLNHRHTEVVALVHLIISLLEAVALASTLLCQVLGKLGTATLLVVGTHIHNLDVREIELQAASHTVQTVWITQQNWFADAFVLGLYGSLQHGRVATLGEYYALWMETGCIVELAGKLGLLTQQLAQSLLVLLPVGDRGTGHAAIHRSLGYGSRYLGDEAWIHWLWNEVLRAECKVVDVVNVVNYIWHWLLSQICDGVNSSHLHLFVDGTGMNIECTTEDVWETDYVVNLVWIV